MPLDTAVPRNEFLCTKKSYGNFELKAKFKLVGDKDKANAGIGQSRQTWSTSAGAPASVPCGAPAMRRASSRRG